MIVPLSAWVFGLLVEAAAAWFIFVLDLPVEALVLHAAACVLIAVVGIRDSSQSRFLPGASVWLFGVMLAVPVAGPICALILVGVIFLLSEKERDEDRIVLGLPGEENAPEGINKDRARSILETLASADTEARREAILSLRSEISPSAVLILQKAVGDSDEQVRNYAQSQLAKWTEQSEARIKRFTEASKKEGVSPTVFMALAESLVEMVLIHLAGPEVEGKYLRGALAALDRIEVGNPLRKNADLLATHCHLRLRQIPQAREVFDRLESAGFVHEAMDALRLRVLFHEKRWSALVEKLRVPSPSSSPDLIKCRNFWLSGGKSA